MTPNVTSNQRKLKQDYPRDAKTGRQINAMRIFCKVHARHGSCRRRQQKRARIISPGYETALEGPEETRARRHHVNGTGARLLSALENLVP